MPNVDQSRINNQHADYTSAAEAARVLDVKPATLYAYVSRGLLRSIAAPSGRARLYSVVDLDRLRRRRDARRGHTAVAAGALDWGAPVLDSAITRIDAAGPHYRGHCALELARTGVPFEQVAELLWQGRANWSTSRRSPRHRPARRALQATAGYGSQLAALASFVASQRLLDRDRHVASPAVERDRAARLIHAMAGALGSAPLSSSAGLAERVCRAFGIRPTIAARASLDHMLILCADHELNISTFSVRVVASGGADLYACITAGLCALSGGAHGGQCDRIELLAASLPPKRTRKTIERALRARLAAGELIPGFGQPLYPDGDPRGLALLGRAEELAPRAPRVRTLLALLEVMRGMGRRDPTLDLGLCALSAALGLPLGAASSIFALGRVAGWVAHALEQRERPILLRPRARYVGP